MTDTPQTTAPYFEAVEIGALVQQVHELKAECRRHAGNVVETWAFATNCIRHNKHARSCIWSDNKACECRASVAVFFPEYANG